MLPRWCGLLLVCSAVAVAVEDESVGHAMKSILFGSDQPNNNSTQSDSLGYTFHQYLQPNSAARQQPSGQACGLPQQIGTGPYRIPRWYFNPARGRCELFYWSGCCGNGNNFQTFQSCQSVCEVDPCTQNKEQGVGAIQMTRYYFNKETKICESFIYFGSGGNRNNFQDLAECQAQCPESPNPCAVATSGPLNQCSPGVNSCGVGYYCHIGAATQTTVCCPKPAAVDKCQQPLNIGVGNANIQRWYFNPLTQQCQSCVYKGLQGNENNFLSKQECENSCLVNPCRVGTPYRSQGVTVQCSASNAGVCPGGYYCHIGADIQTSVCCQAIGGDPCGQPMDRGQGGYQIARWYWNQQQQCCLPFSYCGQKGTQNNFLNKDDCEKTCYELDNPCALGEPQMIPQTNRPIQCSIQSNTCSGDFWCHFGANAQTTVCCPHREEGEAICRQAMVQGTGDAQLPRWYFDLQNRRCVQFMYRGREGNQNNFLSKEQCEQQCPVFVNPCNQPISMPAQSCSVNNPNVCGPSSWCHIGASAETTICCPSEGDPCSLPMSRGTGQQFVDRWYFNQQTGTCQSFTYAGLQGNQNNFLSRESCEERCGPNPCFEGRPFAGVDGRAQTCSVSANLNTCPANYWCHIGADSSTTVCCQGASTNVCNLPMSTGEGNSRLDRYYYDQSSRTCRPFVYNGLKGNQNNFVSLRSCQLACQPLDNPCIGQPATTAAGQVLFCSSTNKDACPVNFWCHLGATPETTVCCPGATNPCSVPLAPGTGNSGLGRWYYNPDDRQCLPFQYNGKRGNQNNFETQADCERTCPEELCLLSIDRGACDGRQTRYAFNRQTSQCVSFEYTGCGGNLNNFATLADCMDTCGNVGFRR